MIPDTATKIACLDYDVPPLTPPTSPTDWQQQWGAYSGSCPETTKFELDHTILRKPPKDSTHYLNSMHYTVSGTCTKEDPIIGTGGISRRAEISSHVQATDAVEGDERWYYLAIRPEVGTLPPEVNYFLVTQWHPKTNRSPALSINFHQSDVEIGETHDAPLKLGSLKNGTWTDYVVHVKFSKYAINKNQVTGWVEAWENGVKKVGGSSPCVKPPQVAVLSQVSCVVPFPALPDKSVFIKQGIYADMDATGTQQVWHDGMTVWKP